MKLVVAVIRPDKLTSVLEALFRADVKGLTLSRVQGHGGEIELSNCVHGGLEVRISLPLMTPFPDGNIASREHQSGHSAGKTAR